MFFISIVGEEEILRQLHEISPLYEDDGDGDPYIRLAERLWDTIRKNDLHNSDFLQLLRVAGDVSALGPPYDESLIGAGVVRAAAAVTKRLLMSGVEVDDGGHESSLLAAAGDIQANCSAATRRPLPVQFRFELDDCTQTIAVTVGSSSYSAVETAGRVWGSAPVLSTFIAALFTAKPHDNKVELSLQKKVSDDSAASLRILEIGCGVGLVSITLHGLLAQADMPATVVASDLSIALPQVEVNCALNGIRVTPLESEVKGDTVTMYCKGLDVTACEADENIGTATVESSCEYNLVLLSDMIYDFTLAPFVVRSTARHLKRGTAVTLPHCEQHGNMANADPVFGPRLNVDNSAFRSAIRSRFHAPTRESGLAVFAVEKHRDGVSRLGSMLQESGLKALGHIQASTFCHRREVPAAGSMTATSVENCVLIFVSFAL